MNHTRHLHVLKGLLDGDAPDSLDVSTGITAANMIRNYKVISAVLVERLSTRHKFDTFVHYSLFRLVPINLSVDTTHVPMVFEVINDRGVRLRRAGPAAAVDTDAPVTSNSSSATQWTPNVAVVRAYEHKGQDGGGGQDWPAE